MNTRNKAEGPSSNEGLLITSEGIHGCGISTQMKMLSSLLGKVLDKNVVFTEWNSYPGLDEFNETMIKYAEDVPMSPITYSLLHSLDFSLRYDESIFPGLQSGKVVIADRYMYTSLVQDTLRGVPELLIRNVYHNVKKPDVILFFDIDPEKASVRLNKEMQSSYKWGLDLRLSDDYYENFLLYQGLQRERYMEFFKETQDIVHVIDASQCIEEQAAQVFSIIKSVLQTKGFFDRKEDFAS